MKMKKLTVCLLLSLGFVTCTNADTTNGDQSPIIRAGGNVTVNYSPSKEEINKIADNLLKKYKETLDEQIKKSITEAISNLGKGQNIAGTEQQIKDAFTALKRGDTSEAKALFTKTAENAVENAKAAKQSENVANKQAAEAYRNLGALAFLDNTQEALQAYRRATQLDPDDVEGWNQLGHLLKRAGDLDEAISAYSKVLALGETHQDQSEIAIAYSSLGLAYHILGESDKALEFHQKSLAIEENLGDKKGLAVQYINLGLVYQSRGELEKAIELYNKSLAITESLGNKEGMAAAYSNLGLVYQKRDELNKAIEFYNKSLTITEKLSAKEGMAINYGNLGTVYKTRGELDKAIGFQKKALTLSEALGYKDGIATACANLGSTYELKDNKVEAKRYYQMSIELFKQLGSPTAQKVQTWLDGLN